MDVDAMRRHAGLNPLPLAATDDQPKPNTEVVTEDATIGNEERLRGIPAVGRVSGTMKGTRPGIDTLRDLEHAGTEIIRGMLQRTRRKDHPA